MLEEAVDRGVRVHLPGRSPRGAGRLPTGTLRGMPGRRFDSFASAEDPPKRPDDPAVRKANLRRIIGLFRPYRRRLASVCALIVFSAAIGVVSPFLLREVLDVAIPEQNVQLLTALVAGMVGIAIVTGVIGVWQTLLSRTVTLARATPLRADGPIRGTRARPGGSAMQCVEAPEGAVLRIRLRRQGNVSPLARAFVT